MTATARIVHTAKDVFNRSALCVHPLVPITHDASPALLDGGVIEPAIRLNPDLPPKLEEMITRLGEVKLGDIRVKRFRVEVEKIVHGLIYECELHEEDGREIEWVMLQPNDIMFHPPWDSGEYST